MKSWPSAHEIWARVLSVKLCVPPSQLETSVSVAPIMVASSLGDIPSSFSLAAILSAIAKDQSTCFVTSCGMVAIVSWNKFVAFIN